MKLHYLAIIAVTSIAANIGTVSAAVSILAGCPYECTLSVFSIHLTLSRTHTFSIKYSLLEVLLLPTLKVQTLFLPR